MYHFKLYRTLVFLCLFSIFFSTNALAENTPLPSWNEGASKQAIITFVEAVTDKNSPDFVPLPERIAVFDNDGTLWSEQPAYFQLFFAMDRVKEMAPAHPEWKTTQPFQAVLEGDMKALGAAGEKGLIELVMATHAGMSTGEFSAIVTNWLQTAKHPTLKRAYPELVFKPMLELLDYLRANDFKTFIVSGGGIEFMRPWVEDVYGIPPEQVVGSSIVTEFTMRDGNPVLTRKAKLNFIDDKAGKPVGINQHIGRRPIFAFGNSDGDLQMLQWTTLGAKGKRFAGLVHHTDKGREFAYDRDSHFGRLDQALIEAKANDWTVVDMKNEWTQVYP
ncbi:MAG: HAD family hydrolase [Thermodesulfobacteriota bacterium]|nr:HAD family hydrolase [Thermodesulfobacteriota bacterium]